METQDDLRGGAIDKIQKEAKQIVFSVTRQMLADEEPSIIYSVLQFTVQMVQLFYILCNRTLIDAWSHPFIANGANSITGYVLITPQAQYMSYPLYIAIMYLFVGIIAIQLIFFVALNNKNEKQGSTLPSQILRSTTHLLFTFFYMPIIDLFIGVFTCNSKGQHFMFNEVQCWAGAHLVHQIVAILFMVLFYIMAVVLSFVYFEARFAYNNPISKASGIDDFFLKTYILLEVLNYSFTNSVNIEIILIILGLVVLYVQLYNQNTYNNYFTYKYWQVIIALQMWTGIMLAFCRVLEDVIFMGAPVAWVFGIPLIMIIVIQNPDERLDLLFLDTTKASSQQVQHLNHHLLRLHHFGNQISMTILEGYLRIHAQSCSRPDCGKSLLKVVHQNYNDAIKRFPYDYQLKIRYGFFLLDFMQEKQSALNELQQANNLQPSFDCEFMIYRYKKVIEDEMNDQSVETLDIHNESVFQQLSKTFQQRIERASLVHMDFWSQLQEDYPDLGRLSVIGAKIHLLLRELEIMWLRLGKYKNNMGKCMRMYGKFMIDVLQDVESGETLFEKSRALEAAYVRNGLQMINQDEISLESLPTMMVSMSSDKFGFIQNLNLACSSFLGYFKNELINRKINILIPNTYAKHHDAMMKEQNIDNKYQKERLIYVKTKSNYILPCVLELKALQTQDLSLVMALQFKQVRSYKTQCFILFDKDNIIDSLSITCLSLLGLELKYIQNKKLQIEEIFPDLLVDKSRYLEKAGFPIMFKPSEDLQAQVTTNDIVESKEQKFQCFLQEINLNGQFLGHIARFEMMDKETLEFPKKVLRSNFQLKYIINKQLIQGDYQNDMVSAIQDTSVMYDYTQNNNDTSSLSQNAEKKSSIPDEGAEEKKINYADGIKTLQLFQNRVQEIDKDEQWEEEEIQQSIFVNNIDQNDDKEAQPNNNAFRSRKNLTEVLEGQTYISVITKLKWISNLSVIGLITLICLEFFYMNTQYGYIQDNLDIVYTQNQMNSYLQSILTGTQNIKMIQLGIWQYANMGTTLDAFYKLQLTMLNTSLNQVQSLNNRLQLSSLSLNSQYEELKQSNVVNMYFNISTIQQYGFLAATQQIISKTFDVYNLNYTLAVQTHPSVFFVEYNLLNDYWVSAQNMSDQLIYALQSRVDDQSQIQVAILSISASVIALYLFSFGISLLFVNANIVEILILFLDIPDKTVKYFYNKCESFITNLQMGEDDDTVSNYEEMDKEEQNELTKTLKSRKKKKKFINSDSSYKDYIIVFTVIMMVLQGYFIFVYFTTQSMLSNLTQQIPEFNVTNRCEPLYRYADNSQRQIFMNRSYQISSADPYATIQNQIVQMYQADTDMQQQHALNVGVTNPTYGTAYNAIMITDPCPIFATYGNDQATCEAFARNAIAQGMQIGVARYVEDLRYIMTIYDQFYGYGTQANFTIIARGDAVASKIVSNAEQNNILNLNNFNQTKESRNIQTLYLRPTFQYLLTNMITGLKNDFTTFGTQKLAVFVVICVLLFVLEFFVWWPFITKLHENVSRTRMLITMIPLRLILKIRSIRTYLRQLINIPDNYI